MDAVVDDIICATCAFNAAKLALMDSTSADPTAAAAGAAAAATAATGAAAAGAA
eukprot:CAMPEP_0174884700 /NCGR_PEP_ID=MMETSP0167-20121228/138_1 /TAXON_ID=38298 /ORGANISM="Rhodella maculata, Strain CCMP736" /LENGTH=53 /DNA_ID=CAMNT_0016120129 /DNA_START=605 /DNA_END=763 /DNA_ORIENTATION=-